MKRENIVQMNTAIGTLPRGAKIQSAKGYRTRNGHTMELTYTVGSSIFRTTIQGGTRA